MGYVPDCFDQWGRRIRLAGSVWLTKIAIPGRIPADCLAEVERAVTDPDFVMHDKAHAERECFYKAGILPSPQYRTFLKVVVEFAAGSTDGVVVTAFPVGRLHRREIQKWP